jgi:hypothetical protein
MTKPLVTCSRVSAVSCCIVPSHEGKRAKARDLLAPIYGWFTEGFGTPVLQEAKTLLDQLSSK